MDSETYRLPAEQFWKKPLIAVGLPWEGGVFLQEFWREGTPFYAVANRADDPVEVSVGEWTGKVGQRIAGPWQVASNSVQCCDIQDLAREYAGDLVCISLNGRPHGLLRAPRPPDFSPDWAATHEILTIDGLNGLGTRTSGLLVRQPRLEFRSGEIVTLVLQTPSKLGSVIFNAKDRPSLPEQIDVVEARTDANSVEKRGDLLIVGVSGEADAGHPTVTLSARMPRVQHDTLCCLTGNVSSGPGGPTFSFARGLLVRSEP
jgi:hypothetical protein